MTQLQWDQVGDRTYETGVDRGVLYKPDGSGVYDVAVPWNGLTTVTEKPTGAAATPQWADNYKYLNLISAEEFGATIQAFTYPDEFAECDGTAIASPGVVVGQQHRKQFGFCYRTLFGNDVDGNDYGYKLHLIYGAQASPAEKAYATVNDSPAIIDFSWDITTIPVAVTGYKPTSLIVVNSTEVDSAALTALEAILYGDGSHDARLPLPDEVIDLFGGTVTSVDLGTPANQPTYNATTHIVTLPAVTGVQWKVNGVNKTAGAQPALSVGQTADVDAVPQDGYTLRGDTDWTFNY